MNNNQLWVVIAYNNDDNYDADTIGIFSTEKLAQKKILEMLKQDFEFATEDDSDEDSVRETLESDKRFKHLDLQNVQWRDIRKYFAMEIKCGECYNLFSYRNYKICRHTITHQ